MEGLVGVDVARADADIRKFSHSCQQSLSSFEKAIRDLGGELSIKWASLKAVEFSTTYNKKASELFQEFTIAWPKIVEDASIALYKLATANGADSAAVLNQMSIETGLINEYAFVKDGNYTLFFNCKENFDGTVGMVVEAVRTALDVFKSRVDYGLEILQNLPDGIAFYDAAGDMVGAYNENISVLKTKFAELFKNILTELSEYVSTEHDVILLAKAQAMDALKGNTTTEKV